uniref:Rad4 beta-hairpin domain-containing protein n=1 Tax=Glossina brevipalpis TaxID=37001 RepID=A0A1A9WWI6_9MUSC
MSDEEDSMSEGFSASEEEWQPNKEKRGGETSDDDDSDFEDTPKPGIVAPTAAGVSKKRAEPKVRSAAKLASSKKRKTPGQSLRAKLYNKYRPPPKTLSPPSHVGNSPSTSNLTRSHPKNVKTPNESNAKREDNENDGSSSDGSIYNYLVNPNEIDLQSSFFNKKQNSEIRKSSSPTPVFNCNAGLGDLTDSESDLDDEDKNEKEFFNFQNILKNLNSLENAEETKAKMDDAKEIATDERSVNNIDAMDVYSVLALGEKQKKQQVHNDGEDEDDEDDDADAENGQKHPQAPSKLNKTKSTRVKRHTRTRPVSTVAADSDDSDWEEVAGQDHPNLLADTSGTTSNLTQQTGNLEIHIELPSRHCGEKKKTRQDLENALKRKLNRDRKDRQLLMHKASLLCRFGRCYFYNRLLNDNGLLQAALKLLPNQNAYPPQKGTEIKYYQSLMTWFKTGIKLVSQNLYPEKTDVTKAKVRTDLLQQLENKEALCKQDMIFMFVALLRGMGIQCRLIFNIQPLPLRPPKSDLLPIKLVQNDKKPDKTPDSKDNLQSKDVKDASSKANVDSKSSKSEPKKGTQKEMKAKAKETSQNMVKVLKGDPEDETNFVLNSEEKESDILKDSTQNKSTATTNESSQEKPRLIRLRQKRVQQEEGETKFVLNSEKNESEILKDSTKSKPPATTSDSSQEKPRLVRLRQTRVQQTELNSQPKRKKSKDSSSYPDVLGKENSHENKKKIAEDASGSNVESSNLLKVRDTRSRSRSRSKSPNVPLISPTFLQTERYKEKLGIMDETTKATTQRLKAKNTIQNKVKISPTFLTEPKTSLTTGRVLRSRIKNDENNQIPQLDGTDDNNASESTNVKTDKHMGKKRPNLLNLRAHKKSKDSDEDFEPSPPKKIKTRKAHKKLKDSDEDFEPSPTEKIKTAPKLAKKDRRVLSTDEDDKLNKSAEKRKSSTTDIWVEVWCDLEEQWMCVDIFKGKIHCVETIVSSASSNLAYVFAFQNDLTIKDVTARYCSHWADVVRKSRVEKQWLDVAIASYLAKRTKRDIKEDQELRHIHEKKPMPKSICDYKNHPFYALERHLLKFEAIYPPNAPVLEIFGYWQTQDYDPPTAENGLVPRNAYGNVDLFKPSMLPKKTVQLRLNGLNRICRKLGIDCANATVGFDFHQGACHPLYDGFVVCEEFAETVTAAWHQEQAELARKEQEKYEARVYNNWKKLIRGLQIRERIKLKYNF